METTDAIVDGNSIDAIDSIRKVEVDNNFLPFSYGVVREGECLGAGECPYDDECYQCYPTPTVNDFDRNSIGNEAEGKGEDIADVHALLLVTLPCLPVYATDNADTYLDTTAIITQHPSLSTQHPSLPTSTLSSLSFIGGHIEDRVLKRNRNYPFIDTRNRNPPSQSRILRKKKRSSVDLDFTQLSKSDLFLYYNCVSDEGKAIAIPDDQLMMEKMNTHTHELPVNQQKLKEIAMMSNHRMNQSVDESERESDRPPGQPIKHMFESLIGVPNDDNSLNLRHYQLIGGSPVQPNDSGPELHYSQSRPEAPSDPYGYPYNTVSAPYNTSSSPFPYNTSPLSPTNIPTIPTNTKEVQDLKSLYDTASKVPPYQYYGTATSSSKDKCARLGGRALTPTDIPISPLSLGGHNNAISLAQNNMTKAKPQSQSLSTNNTNPTTPHIPNPNMWNTTYSPQHNLDSLEEELCDLDALDYGDFHHSTVKLNTTISHHVKYCDEMTGGISNAMESGNNNGGHSDPTPIMQNTTNTPIEDLFYTVLMPSHLKEPPGVRIVDGVITEVVPHSWGEMELIAIFREPIDVELLLERKDPEKTEKAQGHGTQKESLLPQKEKGVSDLLTVTPQFASTSSQKSLQQAHAPQFGSIVTSRELSPMPSPVGQMTANGSTTANQTTASQTLDPNNPHMGELRRFIAGGDNNSMAAIKQSYNNTSYTSVVEPSYSTGAVPNKNTTSNMSTYAYGIIPEEGVDIQPPWSDSLSLQYPPTTKGRGTDGTGTTKPHSIPGTMGHQSILALAQQAQEQPYQLQLAQQAQEQPHQLQLAQQSQQSHSHSQHNAHPVSRTVRSQDPEGDTWEWPDDIKNVYTRYAPRPPSVKDIFHPQPGCVYFSAMIKAGRLGLVLHRDTHTRGSVVVLAMEQKSQYFGYYDPDPDNIAQQSQRHRHHSGNTPQNGSTPRGQVDPTSAAYNATRNRLRYFGSSGNDDGGGSEENDEGAPPLDLIKVLDELVAVAWMRRGVPNPIKTSGLSLTSGNSYSFQSVGSNPGGYPGGYLPGGGEERWSRETFGSPSPRNTGVAYSPRIDGSPRSTHTNTATGPTAGGLGPRWGKVMPIASMSNDQLADTLHGKRPLALYFRRHNKFES